MGGMCVRYFILDLSGELVSPSEVSCLLASPATTPMLCGLAIYSFYVRSRCARQSQQQDISYLLVKSESGKGRDGDGDSDHAKFKATYL